MSCARRLRRSARRTVASAAACAPSSKIGTACALPLAAKLLPDPQTRAAGGRVKVLDFTKYLCDATKCPSVIGGVLVRKDGSHLTRTFAQTLGPFVLRAIG